MQFWEQMLDEFAIHPDALAWYHVPAGKLRMPLSEQFDAVQECLRRGYIEWAGVTCEQWKIGRAHV